VLCMILKGYAIAGEGRVCPCLGFCGHNPAEDTLCL
jgi:hypothetical protein